MPNPKLAVFVTLQSDQFEQTFLSLQEQRWNTGEVDLRAFIVGHPIKNAQLKASLLGFTSAEVLPCMNAELYVKCFNDELRKCRSPYIAFLNEGETIQPNAYAELLECIQMHSSDLIMGGQYEWDEHAQEHRMLTILRYEKLKKYFYNTNLEREPVLAQLIGISGNKIVRTDALLREHIELTEVDGDVQVREFNRRLLMGLERITYLPKRIVNVKSHEWDTTWFQNQLNQMNVVHSRLSNEWARCHYEVAAMQELFGLMESPEFNEMLRPERMAILKEVKAVTSDFQFEFIRSMLPGYSVISKMLQGNNYDGIIQHLELSCQLKQSQAKARLYSRNYKHIKRNVRLAALRIYQMAHGVKQILRGKKFSSSLNIQPPSESSPAADVNRPVSEPLRKIYEQTSDYSLRIKRYDTYIRKYESLLERQNYRRLLNVYRSFQKGWHYVREQSIKFAVQSSAEFVRLTKGKEIWLIAERPSQAEDNGYEFFKYCRETYPNRNAFYVIDRNSPHVDRVSQYGNVIYHSSWKHIIYMLAASKYISAWTTRESLIPSRAFFNQLFGEQVASKMNICLQHGMIIHNISPYLHKELYGLNYIFCSSNKEKEIIKNTLGYRDEEIFVTGLSRFDQLRRSTVEKQQILVMPTWRRYLSKQDEQFFVQSDFYRMYDRLLNNTRLIALLKRYNYELIFYMHHNLQSFSGLFHSRSNLIKVMGPHDARVAELLRSSRLLVTDYSSVATDFLYMKKPVLFYQFDPYHNHHSEVEEIKYRDIGEVVQDDQALISGIEQVLEGSIDIERLERRRSRVFDQIDDQNSNRIYKQICNL
ncbi:CDP-glycerol glycerophosphotransferase family protein [Paenibacillus kobensis]|uniref:CDP-glycerol glycerophosphotransferase family protein n=1 Tax=Paenibacillus kobensis TaxID=59841 RepID=UPI000FDC8B99|nr:CDP-glycerol glycerophosphotransferase family protein [Paenibacillus kobensis]